MADVVTFDFAALRIVEISTGGDNELSVQEIYSEWKQALLDDPARLGFPQAFSVVGGDPITGTLSLGSTFFLENGWRIRPAELSHKLTIVGNLFTREPGQSIFVTTLGAFTVNAESRVSNLIDTVSTTGADPSTIADAVWDEAVAAHVGAGSLGKLLADTAGGVWDEPAAAHVLAGSMGGLLAEADLKILDVFRLIGLDAVLEVEHGQTYIRVPANGSVLNIQVSRVGDKTTLRRL